MRPRLTTGLPFSLAHECTCLTALLAADDEFSMNLEGLGVLIRHFYCFSQHFFELGVNFAEKGRPDQSGPKESPRAGFRA